MNKTTKLLLSAGAIGLGTTVLAGTGFAQGDWGRHHHRGWQSHGGFSTRLLEEYDANGDGKVTQDEIDQARRNAVSQF
ncbi:MAG: hypothetical protein ACREH6_03015, partial [Geminicoccaceae bacterium]